MKLSLNKVLTGLFFASIVIFQAANAAPYAKGNTVNAFQAKDQHEQTYAFDAKTTNFLMISHDMETGKKANGVLTTLGKGFLPGKKAVYIANIHGMPGIGRAFALPKMKQYAHRIILADDAALIGQFPEQKGKVTVLKLSAGKVLSIQYWSPATEGVEQYLK